LRTGLILIIVVLLIITSITPITFGIKIEIKDNLSKEPVEPSNSPPMDSAWPMYCHDTQHTGRSPYSTADNLGIEKWRFRTNGWAVSSPVIDNQGIIYIGASELYAVYPNGTVKWIYDIDGWIEWCCPAIDENGTLYVGTVSSIASYLYAIHSNNGSLKWKYNTGDHIYSSPAIGEDGTIYFGCEDYNIYALYQNGTLRWKYKTGSFVQSSPAIGDDGTIYCGSHDGNLYALYPNNGTLKWKFPTGNWVHGSPTISSDGIIYFGSDSGYLYAIYQNNGTMKWMCNVGSMRASPALDAEEILYFGVWEKLFYAIYPNGTIKWTFNPEQRIWGSSAAISADGSIYFGTCDLDNEGGLDIIVLNSDGTLKWRKEIGTLFSSFAIDMDGNVYIGSSGINDGFLHAFGPQEYNNPPETPTINGPTNGIAGTSYDYTFLAIDNENNPISYFIDWDDGTTTGWTGDYASGEEITLSHSWNEKGTYSITCKALDTFGLESNIGSLSITMPRNKNMILHDFLDFFPNIKGVIIWLLNH
jgi:outer membrane protein assembly factor BamB